MTSRITTDSALNIPREVAQAGSTLGIDPLSLRGVPFCHCEER